MTKKLIIKKLFTIFFFFLLASCSFLNPQSSNEFTVSKKPPLIMPPDMNMTPPDSKELRKKNFNKDNRAYNDDNASLEDILTGDTGIKKNTNTKSIKKTNVSRKNLINRILRAQASKILE